MPPLVYYKCSKCKRTHDSYIDAVKCEKSHLAAVSVRELEYKSGAYPFRISLLFPDGKEQGYITDDGIYTGNEVNYAYNKNKKYD